jgi:hypothetical protein
MSQMKLLAGGGIQALDITMLRVASLLNSVESLVDGSGTWQMRIPASLTDKSVEIVLKCPHNKIRASSVSLSFLNTSGAAPGDIAVNIYKEAVESCRYYHAPHQVPVPMTPNDIFGALIDDLGILQPYMLVDPPHDTEWSQYPPKSAGESIVTALETLVPAIRDCIEQCPAAGQKNVHPTPHAPLMLCGTGHSAPYAGPILTVVIHLNDYHRWTREQVADWLDSLEDVDLTIKPLPKAKITDAGSDTAAQIENVYNSLGVPGLFASVS